MRQTGPSPEHADHQHLLEPYYQRMEEQEAFLVDSGIELARGSAAFMKKWMQAWESGTVAALADCLTEDISFADSTTACRDVHGKDLTLDFMQKMYDAMPDMVFYPQDDTLRSMPYWDFFGGEIRCTWPWRGIARWTGPLTNPVGGATMPPTGRTFNFIGVDRYVISADWRISRIDTDWDQLTHIRQLIPIPLPDFDGPTARIVGRVATAVAPAVQAVARRR